MILDNCRYYNETLLTSLKKKKKITSIKNNQLSLNYYFCAIDVYPYPYTGVGIHLRKI